MAQVTYKKSLLKAKVKLLKTEILCIKVYDNDDDYDDAKWDGKS